jgi:hypothetical protein
MSTQMARVVFWPVLAVATLTTGHSAPPWVEQRVDQRVDRVDQVDQWVGQGKQKQDSPKKEQKARMDSLTGCIDQQDGRYVLVNDHTLSPVAVLEADGFATEGFAKHMGHKVTVRGVSSPAGAVPIFKVRGIETISDICAPQQ